MPHSLHFNWWNIWNRTIRVGGFGGGRPTLAELRKLNEPGLGIKPAGSWLREGIENMDGSSILGALLDDFGCFLGIWMFWISIIFRWVNSDDSYRRQCHLGHKLTRTRWTAWWGEEGGRLGQPATFCREKSSGCSSKHSCSSYSLQYL